MVAKRVPTQLLVAAFHEEDTATAVKDLLIEGMKEKQILCTNIAVIKKDKDSVVNVKELGKVTALDGALAGGAKGTVVGALVGGVACLLMGPAGVMVGAAAGSAVGAGTGAAIGGFGASHIESMDQGKLNELGSSLGPSNSAIVAVFDEQLVDKSEYEKMTEIKEAKEVVLKRMEEKICENLKKGKDIAYLFAVADDGIAAMRLIEGPESGDLKAFVLTPEVYVSAEVAANEQGVATEAVMATKEGIAVEDTVTTKKGTAVQDVVVTKEGVAAGRALITEDEIAYEVGAATKHEEVVKKGVVVADRDGDVVVVEATRDTTYA